MHGAILACFNTHFWHLQLDISLDLDVIAGFVIQDSVAHCLQNVLSEVGFEPTPTFVDQNAPIRKSFTLESGALDRSAILTCLLRKESKYLNARKAKFHFS